MDIDVLLLSYFDKICLILTGEPGRALAYLYSGYIRERGYIREPERRLFLSRLHYILQVTPLCV